MAKKLGCTKALNPKDYDKPMQQVLVGESPTGFGYDYTFDCTGNTDVMRSALEAAHRGWGQCCLIGVAASGKEIATRPFQFITGRRCLGTAFGGWKTRDAIPMLVNKVQKGAQRAEHGNGSHSLTAPRCMPAGLPTNPPAHPSACVLPLRAVRRRDRARSLRHTPLQWCRGHPEGH